MSTYKDISEFKPGDILDSYLGIVYEVVDYNKKGRESKLKNIGSGSITTATHFKNKNFKLKIKDLGLM